MTGDGNTIGELAAMDMEVTAFCHACNRHRMIDLGAIGKQFGRDMPIRRVALRLVCEGCGARDCGVLIARRGRYGN